MIGRLRKFHEGTGYLSGALIDDAEGLPSSTAYRLRFGGLVEAYRMAGYTPERSYEDVEINRRLRATYPHLLDDLMQDLESVTDAREEFSSLDAQREAAEAYVLSQRARGWRALPDRYDDAGLSGATAERPALQRLLEDVDAGRVTIRLPARRRGGRRGGAVGAEGASGAPDTAQSPIPERIPRVARVLALAHHWQGLIRSGAVRDQADLAQLVGVSRGRVTQVMRLLHLAPEIQAQLLDGRVDPSGGEGSLRALADLPLWAAHRRAWDSMKLGAPFP